MNRRDALVMDKLLIRFGASMILYATLSNACDANKNSERAYNAAQAARYDVVQIDTTIAKLEKTLASQQPRTSHSAYFELNADIIGGPGKDRFAYNLDGTITLLEIDGDAPKTCPAYTRNILGSPAMDVYEQCPDGTITLLEIDGKLPGNYDPNKVSQYARPPLPFRLPNAER